MKRDQIRSGRNAFYVSLMTPHKQAYDIAGNVVG
jgi:hypothetical protein